MVICNRFSFGIKNRRVKMNTRTTTAKDMQVNEYIKKIEEFEKISLEKSKNVRALYKMMQVVTNRFNEITPVICHVQEGVSEEYDSTGLRFQLLLDQKPTEIEMKIVFDGDEILVLDISNPYSGTSEEPSEYDFSYTLKAGEDLDLRRAFPCFSEQQIEVLMNHFMNLIRLYAEGGTIDES